MSLTFRSSITNAEDWSSTCQFKDKETGEPIDFTGASINLQVSDLDGCSRVSATTDNGKVLIVGPGTFSIYVPASETRHLCPGAYKLGCTYAYGGDTVSLFTGTLTVTDGVTRSWQTHY